MGAITIVAMTVEHATEIVTWRYPHPFDCYDLSGVEPLSLVASDSSFHTLIEDHCVIGFRSFGADGRVPGGAYDDSALDTGGGLRPDLTSHGRGYVAIRAGLAYGKATYDPPAFRVTVAAFNTRALTVLRRIGFTRVSTFDAITDGRRYEVLVLPADELNT